MAAISTYKKLNKDILMEFIYDSSNIITDPYYILINSRSNTRSYIAGDTSATGNIKDQTLFNVDRVSNKFAVVDTSRYNFLNLQEFTPSIGIRHDTLKIYLPNNFNFTNYEGFYLRVYTYDIDNKKIYDISNYLFDKNINSNLIEEVTPFLYFEEKLWNKYIQLNIPSVYAIGLQRAGIEVTANTINYNLTSGVGISQTAPIFVDFQFIARKTTLGSLTNYFTTPAFTTQFAQTPELEELKLRIDPSPNGDYFEIYSTYNNSFDEYVTFIENSKRVSKVYVAEYNVTVYEENIRGKSSRFLVKSDFYEKIEFRPILKYATSNAQINVEMKLINLVDNSVIIRKAGYGFRPEEIAKYGLSFRKVKVRDVHKPKIYVKKTTQIESQTFLGTNQQPENVIQVPTPVLLSLSNISAFSKQSLNKISASGREIDKYSGLGKLKIGITPFDNIIDFTLVYKFNKTIEPIDLTSCQDLKLTFKTADSLLEFPLYFDSNQNLENRNNPKFGKCVFKIPSSKFLEIKKLQKSNQNLFYITTLNQNVKTIIYSGIFSITDNLSNLGINSTFDVTNLDNNNIVGNGLILEPRIIEDEALLQQNAIVTRKIVRTTETGTFSNI